MLLLSVNYFCMLDEFAESNEDNHGNHGVEFQRQKRDISFSDLGPLKDIERKDLNCAVKEYLLLAGYRLTAMTFYEEVRMHAQTLFFLFPSSLLLCLFKPVIDRSCAKL